MQGGYQLGLTTPNKLLVVYQTLFGVQPTQPAPLGFGQPVSSAFLLLCSPAPCHTGMYYTPPTVCCQPKHQAATGQVTAARSAKNCSRAVSGGKKCKGRQKHLVCARRGSKSSKRLTSVPSCLIRACLALNTPHCIAASRAAIRADANHCSWKASSSGG